ncbi:MAG: hypothetical protein BZ151_00095 [Desulfobacca sp. 4484_104]|nr:MAG: hypothetical protein BZ151_00095 [Desulfobacca sp. 4484_104]
MHLDQMADAGFQGGDVKVQFAGPVIDIGPVQGALLPLITGQNCAAGRVRFQPSTAGIFRRYVETE